MSTLLNTTDLKKIPVMARVKRHLKYYEDIQKKLDAYQTKKQLLLHRKDILEKQNRINYQNEYNRLVGALSVNGHTGKTISMLQDRKKRLVELGAKATDT